jgi:ketosteroid isomerase-like protein
MHEQLGPGEVHRRLIDMYPELLAGGRLDEGLAFIDPDVVDHLGGAHGDHVGIDAWREKWERMIAGDFDAGFHDVSVTVEQNVVSGDTSVNRYTSRGTHIASGKRYAVTSMDMIRVRNGRVVEHWALRDQNAMRHQLGLNP